MKKVLFFFAVALMLCSVLPTMAQQRKSVKRPVTSKVKTMTKQTVSSKPTVKTTAIYEIKAGVKNACVTDNAIYYLEKGKNNAIMSIDRKTGNKSIVIPGIENVYENARPTIRKFFVFGNRFILECGRDNFTDDGIYVYDGKSIETSMKLSNKGNVVVGNEKYFLIDNPDIHTVSYWSVEDLKILKKIDGLNTAGWFLPRFIASDGSVWSTWGLDVECFTLSGQRKDYSLKNERYIVQEKYVASLTGKGVQKGNFLYFSCDRRIYRLNMLSPNKWEEYAKTPATIDNRFEWFCPDANGNLYTQGVSNKDDNTQYWKVGNFDSPKALGRDLMTGFTNWGNTKIWVNLCKNYTDIDGNLISVGNNTIYIYNPNGIIGYINAVGKIIEKE